MRHWAVWGKDASNRACNVAKKRKDHDCCPYGFCNHLVHWLCWRQNKHIVPSNTFESNSIFSQPNKTHAGRARFQTLWPQSTKASLSKKVTSADKCWTFQVTWGPHMSFFLARNQPRKKKRFHTPALWERKRLCPEESMKSAPRCVSRPAPVYSGVSLSLVRGFGGSNRTIVYVGRFHVSVRVGKNFGDPIQARSKDFSQ